MNKTELVAAMAEQADMTKKDAEKALTAFTEVVAKELKKGEKIQLVGFMEAMDITQLESFDAGIMFAQTEGIIPAPKSCHAIAATISEAKKMH